MSSLCFSLSHVQDRLQPRLQDGLTIHWSRLAGVSEQSQAIKATTAQQHQHVQPLSSGSSEHRSFPAAEDNASSLPAKTRWRVTHAGNGCELSRRQQRRTGGYRNYDGRDHEQYGTSRGHWLPDNQMDKRMRAGERQRRTDRGEECETVMTGKIHREARSA